MTRTTHKTVHKTVNVTLVRSPWGRLPKHRACLIGLGLRRVGSQRELEDTPAVRGMIDKVRYLLDVESSETDAADVDASGAVDETVDETVEETVESDQP